MKVIFLDFNGVLDTYLNMDEIDENNLKRLKNIVINTDAKVVISSSLKNNFYHRKVLSIKLQTIINILFENNIEVIGITPLCDNREEEIKKYLKTHPNIENYCIIDDDYDMVSFKEHMIKLPCQSEFSNGLDEISMNNAIKVLNKNNT